MPAISSDNPSLNGLDARAPLTADPARLASVAPELVVAAWAATGTHRQTTGELTTRLSVIYGEGYAAANALNVALGKDYLTQADGNISITQDGQAALDAALGANRPSGEPYVLKAFAAIALGVKPSERKKMTALSRVDALQSAAIARLYGLAVGETPSRSAVRFALAKRLLIDQFPEYANYLAKAASSDARPNALITALIMGHIGGSHTSLMEAETHMLSNVLGAKSRTKSELAAGLIRAASSPQLRPPREVSRSQLPKQPGIEEFAGAVRCIAKAMETQPYAGRVAIAQVYDAGVSQGLAFGALDEFKKRVADACRAGHLDLERYDIAGPLDASLRERSRTPFGRDERHFIVNQWI